MNPPTRPGLAPGIDTVGLSPFEGSIKLILGSMFAEKSTEMISEARRAALAAQPAVIVKYVEDVRYGDGPVVATHADLRQETTVATAEMAPIRVVVVGRLSEVTLAPDEMFIGVDEGQFFPDLSEVCERWANEGRRVVVAALDGTFERKPFPSEEVLKLIPRCEEVVKRHGVCMDCRRRASSFSRRIGKETAVVLIGAKKEYRAVCRKCFHAALAPVAPAPPRRRRAKRLGRRVRAPATGVSTRRAGTVTKS